MTPEEASAFLGSTAKQAAETAKNAAEKAVSGVSGLLDWLKPSPAKPKPLPYQGPTPEGVALLVMRVAGGMALTDQALDRAAERLKEGGYNDQAKNYGSIRCLVAHEHGTDGRCIACSGPSGKAYFLRCFGSDQRGLTQMLTVVRARTMGGAIAPPCPGCQIRDAERTSSPEAPWGLCAVCKALRAAELARAVEQDPALQAVRKAKDKLKAELSGKPWFRGIGIGEDKGNATLEVRVAKKITPRIKRAIPSKVKDENGAWITVRTEAIGDVVAQGTELAGYRSMEIHSKAPPAENGESGGVDDLGGAGDELAQWVGQADDEALTTYEEEKRSIKEALEDKAHELAAAWAGLVERMRQSPAVARVVGPLHQKWQEFWGGWQDGSTDGLAGAVDVTNEALASARQASLMGLDDNGIKEFRYLDQRWKRMSDWAKDNCGHHRKADAPPCKLTDTQTKNLTDWLARWINYADDVNKWMANRGSIFGESNIVPSSIADWRKEFDSWETELRKAGFEQDAAPTPKPAEYKPSPDAGLLPSGLQQYLPSTGKVAAVAGGLVALIIAALAVTRR